MSMVFILICSFETFWTNWWRSVPFAFSKKKLRPPSRCGPDLAPTDIFLFLAVKSFLKWHHHGTLSAVREACTRTLNDLPELAYKGALNLCGKAADDDQGMYFENFKVFFSNTWNKSIVPKVFAILHSFISRKVVSVLLRNLKLGIFRIFLLWILPFTWIWVGLRRQTCSWWWSQFLCCTYVKL